MQLDEFQSTKRKDPKAGRWSGEGGYRFRCCGCRKEGKTAETDRRKRAGSAKVKRIKRAQFGNWSTRDGNVSDGCSSPGASRRPDQD